MRKYTTIFCFFFVLGLISSCSDGKNQNYRNDTIGLSQKEIEFSNKLDSCLIKTRNDDWSFSSIHILDDIKDEYRSFYGIRMIGDWFYIEKRYNGIFVKVHINNSYCRRKLIITIQDRNYFDYLQINQLGLVGK